MLIVTAVEPSTEAGHFVFSASDSFDATVSVTAVEPPSIGAPVELVWVPA